MEFKLKRVNLILIGLVSLLGAGCGSSENTIQDDWPGVDKLTLIDSPSSFQTKSSETFTLGSALLIPKLGKDVSYFIKTTCHRKDPEALEEAHRKVSKTTPFPAGESQYLRPHFVSNLIPEELVIFPEHFLNCDFEFEAKNQHGSTDKNLLLQRTFSEAELSKRNLKFSPPSSLNREKLYHHHLQKLVLSSKQSFNDLKIFCYSQRLRKAQQGIKYNSEKFETSVNLKSFILPYPEFSYRIEHCIAQAQSREGKFLYSNKLDLINASVGYTPDIQIELLSHIHDDRNKAFVPYDPSEKLLEVEIFKFRISNLEDVALKLNLDLCGKPGAVNVISGEDWLIHVKPWKNKQTIITDYKIFKSTKASARLLCYSEGEGVQNIILNAKSAVTLSVILQVQSRAGKGFFISDRDFLQSIAVEQLNVFHSGKVAELNIFEYALRQTPVYVGEGVLELTKINSEARFAILFGSKFIDKKFFLPEIISDMKGEPLPGEPIIEYIDP